MRIVITGGKGFVGTHLAEKWIELGHQVGIFDLPGYNITNAVDVCDVIDSDTDVIVHLAAQVRVDEAIKNPTETFATNIGGTINVLEAMRKNDIPKIIFASTADVYGGTMYPDPIAEGEPLRTANPYGASKLAAERICYAYGQTYGVKVNILRCFNIYGPGQKAGAVTIFTKKALSGDILSINGRGDQCRDYVYIDDVVNAYDFALGKDCPLPINIGTGVATSARSLAETVVCVTGSLSKIAYSVTEDERPSGHLVANRSLAEYYLNWTPMVPLKEGIKLTASVLK